MFGILKRTVSEKISGIVDSLSPSSSAREETPNKHKRTREEKIKDEQELQFDILVTPPEKRLKQINQDIGSPSQSNTLSNFKEFINLSKLLRNNFLWKYVVQGDKGSGIQLNRDNLEARIDNSLTKMDKQNKHAAFDMQALNKDFLLDSPSPWQFRKIEEPLVKSVQPQVNQISRRRALHPAIPHSSDEYQPLKSSTKAEPYIISKAFPSGETEMPNHVETDAAELEELNPSEHPRERASYVQMNSTRKPNTVDTVIRLAERDRYRKLLARFSSCQNSAMNSNENSVVHHRSTFETHTKPLDIEDSFPRLKEADSIVKKFQRSLSRNEESNSVLSSTRVSFEDETIKCNSESLLREIPKSSNGLKEAMRSFSGRNTANLSRIERKSPENEGLLGNAWTSKWRQILTQDDQDRQKRIAREEKKLKDLSKKRKERELDLLKKVEARRELDKKKSKEKLPPLTKEMEQVISSALRRGSPSDTLVEAFNMSVTRHDVATLAASNWLNDEVVNFYFNLLHERSSQPGNLKMHFFNSFFYPKLLRTGYSGVRRWTKKVDIFSMDIVVLPVHLGMHWCLAAIDMRKKEIAYYDSLKGNNMQCITALRNYIIEEHKDKKKANLNISEWTETLPKDIPEQLNGCDCGVFTCKYAECLTRGSELNFTQNDMPYFRRRIIYEIVTKKLL